MGSKAELVPVVALKKLTSVPHRPQAMFLIRTQFCAGNGGSGMFLLYLTAFKPVNNSGLQNFAAALVASIRGISFSK
jgi:hypothetical protein